MLDLSKPIQTRDGKPVRIIATDVKGDTENKLIGLVDVGEEEVLAVRTVDGLIRDDGVENDHDFVNVPMRETVFVSIAQTYSAAAAAARGDPDWPVLAIEVEHDGDLKNISRVIGVELSK